MRTHAMRMIKQMTPSELLHYLYPRILPLHTLTPEQGFADPTTGLLNIPQELRASFANIQEGGAYLVDNGQICLLWLHQLVSPNLLQDLFGEHVTSLQELDPFAADVLPVIDTVLNAQTRNLVAWLEGKRGVGRRIRVQLARQGMDGAEYEFASLLVEDRNNEAQSYVDWLVAVHRNVQMDVCHASSLFCLSTCALTLTLQLGLIHPSLTLTSTFSLPSHTVITLSNNSSLPLLNFLILISPLSYR